MENTHYFDGVELEVDEKEVEEEVEERWEALLGFL